MWWAITDVLLHLHCCVVGCYRRVGAFALLCESVWWAVTDMLLHLHCCVVGSYRGVAAFALLCGGLLQTCCCICIAVWWAVTDVLLKCLGMDWELHRPFLQKAETLAQQLKDVDDPAMHKYYRSPVSQTLDTYISHSKFYR